MAFDIGLAREANYLQACQKRATLLAKNIANSNTPHYKAQDINFSDVVSQVKLNAGLVKTSPLHLNDKNLSANGASLYYRIPMQFKANQNTVDEDIERKNFIENTLRYQSTLSILQQKASLLMKAIRGE